MLTFRDAGVLVLAAHSVARGKPDALRRALRLGFTHKSVVDTLIPWTFGTAPLLFTAFRTENAQSFSDLLAAGADPWVSSSTGHSTWEAVLASGNSNLIAMFFRAQDDATGGLQWDHDLHAAVIAGDTAACRRLVTSGMAAVDGGGRGGVTALQLACMIHLPQVAHALMELGADVDVTDDRGRTAAHYASECPVRCACLVHTTATHHAATAKDRDGLTALHLAAANGSAKAVEALVFWAGADPNDKDASGRTPLAMCIQHCPDTAEALCTAWELLQHGATVNADTLRLAAAQPGAQGMAVLAVCIRATGCRLPREGIERATHDLQDETLPLTDRATALAALKCEEDKSASKCKALMDGTDRWRR
jgi:hypothetical protein